MKPLGLREHGTAWVGALAKEAERMRACDAHGSRSDDTRSPRPRPLQRHARRCAGKEVRERGRAP